MLIGRKIILSPIMIHRTSTSFGDSPDLEIRFRRSGIFGVGNKPVRSYTLQIKTKKREIQLTLVFRPGVTRYWFNKSQWR